MSSSLIELDQAELDQAEADQAGLDQAGVAVFAPDLMIVGMCILLNDRTSTSRQKGDEFRRSTPCDARRQDVPEFMADGTSGRRTVEPFGASR